MTSLPLESHRNQEIIAALDGGAPLFVAAVAGEAAYLPDNAALLLTGIGTIPAAMTLSHVLADAAAAGVAPSRIVNLGTAGALHDGLSGVFEISQVWKYDFRLEVLSDISRYLLPDVLEIAPVSSTGNALPAATLATGDSFVSDSATRSELAARAQLCDMEGYAIAAVAQRFGIPVTLLKQVSDNANETSVGNWAAAVDRGAQQLAAAVARLGLRA